MGKLDRFLYGRNRPDGEARAWAGLPWAGDGRPIYDGSQWLSSQMSWGPNERMVLSGERQAFLSNGTVYGIVRTRADLFSQVSFCWKRFGAGPRPMASDTFTDNSLAPLDNPSPILEWMELDVADAGNSYWVFDGPVLRRLPPRWCTIVLGSRFEVKDPALAWDAEPIGLIFQPDGVPDNKAETFRWSEVAHYCPERDPNARFRGMSWLRPVLEDITADNGARRYLTKFWENNATPNLVMKFPPEVEVEKVRAFRDLFLAKHQGVDRAFRTAFIGGGADPMVIGSKLAELDTEQIRKQLHLDVTLAGGVPPIAAGIFEGTYANSKEANRSLADRKLRYLWLKAVDALRPLFPPPTGSELWYDATGVSALQSDAIDDAEVMTKNANTLRTLWDGGADPDSALAAVTTGDLSKVTHSGNLSVQLLPGGSAPTTPGANDDG